MRIVQIETLGDGGLVGDTEVAGSTVPFCFPGNFAKYTIWTQVLGPLTITATGWRLSTGFWRDSVGLRTHSFCRAFVRQTLMLGQNVWLRISIPVLPKGA